MVTKKDRILLICVYMGKLPFWMPAFLFSCKYNQDVNWLIVSDEHPSVDMPENVKFINMNTREFSELSSASLGFNINISSTYAYKICDLKVAFGNIFKRELSGFNFWGFCDLDIVWGDIRKFITNDILSVYDIITSRENRISGHFCLFRNNIGINNIYNNIKKVQIMIKDNGKCYGIDENYLTYHLDSLIAPSFWIKIKKLLNPKIKNQKLNVYWDRVLTTSGAHQRALDEGIKQNFLWKDGKTFSADRNNEFMYIHFHKMKQNMDTIDFKYSDMPASFVINRKGFFSNHE